MLLPIENGIPATTIVPSIKTQIPLKICSQSCPVGSNLFTGLFPQYEYKFNPLILSGSKYSIESCEIHLHNSGE